MRNTMWISEGDDAHVLEVWQGEHGLRTEHYRLPRLHVKMVEAANRGILSRTRK